MFLYFIKNKWQYIVLSILSGFIVFSIIQDKGLLNKKVIIKEEQVKKEVAAPACTKQEVELIVGESAILKQMNLFVMDLANTKYISDSLTTDYWSKRKMYGVKRELIVGAKQVYIMIYEPVDELKYNAKEYQRFLLRDKKIEK